MTADTPLLRPQWQAIELINVTPQAASPVRHKVLLDLGRQVQRCADDRR
ncbi:hypothetical protein HPTD01_2692 [Halomonas sp. TD01]|nr:hypothetical protein HPTD01_2692 [Halomonas sp. TD01]